MDAKNPISAQELFRNGPIGAYNCIYEHIYIARVTKIPQSKNYNSRQKLFYE